MATRDFLRKYRAFARRLFPDASEKELFSKKVVLAVRDHKESPFKLKEFGKENAGGFRSPDQILARFPEDAGGATSA